MFALKNLVTKTPRLAALAAPQQRTILSGPPTVRVSVTEKILHGVVMLAGFMAIPMWVMTHLEDYRQKKP